MAFRGELSAKWQFSKNIIKHIFLCKRALTFWKVFELSLPISLLGLITVVRMYYNYRGFNVLSIFTY